MKIHQTPPQTSAFRSIAPCVFSFLIGAITLIVLIGAFAKKNTFIGKPELIAFAHTLGHDYFREQGVGVIGALRAAPGNYFRPVDIPKITLNINFDNWQKILGKRAKALDLGYLVQEADDFVPASISYSDTQTQGGAKAKVRLKGDLLDHLEGKKWSFRIRTKQKDHVFGMRRFSLQKPETRHFQSTPIMLSLLKSMGLMSPRYFFVDLTINGKHIGIMALEEHPAKELIEASGRKESVILRYSEKNYFSAIRHPHGIRTPLDVRLESGQTHPFDDYRLTPIDAFQSSRIAKSETLSKNYRTAAGLLRGFSDGRLPASKVFDVELMGRFLALSELFGAWHGVRWKSVRFYFNPQTARLEPVPFDMTASLRWEEIISERYQFVRALLRDEKINQAFRANLRRLIQDTQSGKLIQSVKAAEKGHLQRLQKEYMLLGAFPTKRLDKRVPMLLRRLFDERRTAIAPKRYNQYVVARDFDDGGKRMLALFNATLSPVTVKRISFAECTGAPPTSGDAVAEGILPLVLPPGDRISRPQSVSIEANSEIGQNCRLMVDSHVAGNDEIKSVSADSDAVALAGRPIPEGSLNELLARWSFLSFDQDRNVLSVVPGDHSIRHDFVVPAGTTLEIGGGTTLRFAPDSAIIGHGPVLFNGTAKAPITLRPLDDKKGWQGIAIIRAGGRSKVRHTRFIHTTGVVKRGWSLTGGVTFYESDVDIVGASFQGHNGEDALNTVRSDFTMDRTTFDTTLSDAFDSDFCTGKITNSTFVNIGTAGGGDAVDTSGSRVVITDTKFRQVSDKSISVGEASNVSASGIDIADTGTGLASKDRSTLKARNVTIKNAKFAALTAYIKKPEYGGATIIADDIAVSGGNTRNLVQNGSQIILAGRSLDTQDIDIDALYETVMKPGAR